MQWHDGRAMRHTRFRYWLLNTILRLKTPGTRNVFYHTNAGAEDLLLSDLRDPARRKQIVQRMTTASALLPGSVGERRQMRQNLERKWRPVVRLNRKAVDVYQLVSLLSRLRLTSGHIFMT